MCCFVRCLPYTDQCPLQGTSLEVPPPYLPPPTLIHCSSPSLRCSLPPPIASSLPSFPRSVHAYVPSAIVPFLKPPSLPPLPLPPSLSSSLPRSPLLPLSHPPSFLGPSLPTCLRPSNSMYTVCVFGKLHCIVYHLAMRDTETIGCSCKKKVSFQWPAVTFSERSPTSNPFLTKSKIIRRST